MKLFFKHLLRTAAKKPLQPILLVLTLTLAVMVTVFTFTLNRLIDEENVQVQAVTYGSADLTVTLDGASTSRFMFVKDAEAVLGDSARVAGCFTLPLTMGEQKSAVSGVAVDFSEIERIFDFTFTEYGTLTPSGVPTAAFVTRRFAEENGLSVNDRFTVTALGEERTYTVVGISAAPLIASHDVIVDVSGIVRLIAGDSLLLSSMKDGFRPCSTIYIDLLDGTVEAAMKKLSASPTFGANTLRDVSNEVARASNAQTLSVALDIAIVLACVLAAAVAFCCLYILASERTEENRSFLLSGARASQLHALQYAEVLVYWLIGSAVGISLVIPLMRSFASAAGFLYASPQPDFADVAKSALIVLATSMLTVLIFTSSSRMRKPVKKRSVPLLLFLLPLLTVLILSVLVCTLSLKARFFLYIPLVLFLALTVFLYAAPLLRAWMRLIDRFLERKKQKRQRESFVSLHYAVKNVFSVRILHNTARLLSLLILVVASVSAVILSAIGHVRFAKRSLAAEYTVLGATENCYQKVSASDAVADCYKIYMQNAASKDGGLINLLGASDMQAFSEAMRPSRAPKGNSAAISIGEAHAYNLKVGDRIEVDRDGQRITLVVDEILDVSARCVIFDNEYFGQHYNMLGVRSKEGVSEAEVFAQLSAVTANELATVMRTETFLEERMETLGVYIISGLVLLSVVIAFALIGTLDNLFQSYRARRGDFLLYRLSGMSRAQVRRMKCAEVLITALFGTVLAAVATLAFLLLTNVALRIHAYEIFLSLRFFFGS